MSRRFQFSLRAFLVVLTIAAAYSAFMAKLPPGARFAVGLFGLSVAGKLFSEVLTDEPHHRYVLKWRRRHSRRPTVSLEDI